MWTAENRPNYERKGQRYPSDLSDEEWALVEPLLPPERRVSRRDVLDAILYVLTTGADSGDGGQRFRSIADSNPVIADST